ncbi:phosphoenolpyruvate carboxykinase (ATP) [Rubrobacter tropicus]|uniref:Phosphoenolpyruvate carboxykinase (ATP) n=1 Tax=Rubrobacter tropicus TaxID=2653851 RepID=A0A6G8QBI2_9ACTN|nr:phosphoenolpyruvate carboxykinase (ATP) [Rubrobacter tropicus]QIN83829.1 phosphoenolpyruvate carboxykinase (ATP) [Rubrobacter tropicus]
MDLAVRKESLERFGVENLGAVHENLPPARLVEASVRRREGMICEPSGALVVRTGKRTGRSPKDRFIVEDDLTRDAVDWGAVNKPFSSEAFGRLLEKAAGYVENLEEVFVVDAHAGADERYSLNVQVVTEHAWQALFARQLFRRPDKGELDRFEPEWTVISMPGLLMEPEEDGTESETFVGLDFSRRVVLVCGTRYAGEIKKSIFTALNFVLPTEHNVMPMHCSANVGEEDDVALFFGLSGTGKTTLSADPERRLIGDDEHGWSDSGVFNFEGGCYAKTIDLSPEKEPQIWGAIRFGAVLENVAMDRRTRAVDFTDASITENTRVAYPLEYIEGAVPDGKGAHPKAVLFLTADAFGVLPPISALSPEQAAYYFLSGYTAKLAGTEADMDSEVEATFSACFGAPFLPLPATTYATMLSERLREHGARCYLINTGWSGGAYGVGERIDLSATREMVRAVIEGRLDGAETRQHSVFGLNVPVEVPGVPTEVLDPRGTWPDKDAYDEQAKKLADLFRENFTKFEGSVTDEVRNAGPQL